LFQYLSRRLSKYDGGDGMRRAPLTISHGIVLLMAVLVALAPIAPNLMLYDARASDQISVPENARGEPPSHARSGGGTHDPPGRDHRPSPPSSDEDEAPWADERPVEPQTFQRSQRPPTVEEIPHRAPWVDSKVPPRSAVPFEGDAERSTLQGIDDEAGMSVFSQGASVQSDDFNSDTLNTNLWEFVDPVGDGSYEVRGNNAQISIPGGVSHDIWVNGNRAPRLVQSATNEDFDFEIKFNTMPHGTNAMQGLLVEADAQNFIRFDFYSNNDTLNIFSATFANGSPSTRVNSQILKGAPLYLRVTRAGHQWTMLYSYDGEAWTTATVFTFQLQVSKVGFYAGNSGSSPAFFSAVDYFMNNEARIDPINANPGVDTFPPRVHQESYSPSHDSISVEWFTDEPATSVVEFGETTAYELGTVSDDAQRVWHTLTLTGLSQVTNYHLRITSSDPNGNSTTIHPVVIRTDPSPTSGPYIDLWYGNYQRFGHIGNPQKWVNIHGTVVSAHPVSSLGYQLNGGQIHALSIGPDSRRLVAPGDFIIEIDYQNLLDGSNTVTIHSTDSLGQQSVQDVTIEYSVGNAWPLPATVGWNSADSVNEVAQVVDGHWAIQEGGLRTLDPGYDRLVAVGDLTWTDYEVSVPITIHSLGTAANGPGVGILVRWPGHYDWDGSQPRHGWHPMGAIGWYRNNLLQEGGIRLNMYGGGDRILAEDTSGRKLDLGVPYMFKMRVESRPEQSSLYQLKVWEQGTPEPGEWDLVSGGYSTELEHGSLLLLAHHADATFGSVQVTPLSDAPPTDPDPPDETDPPTDPDPPDEPDPDPPASGIESDYFTSETLDTDRWQFIDPIGDSSLVLTGSHAELSVPGGIPHDVWTNGNDSARLMQSVNDVDFEVEVKFDSRPHGTHAMQGIIVEQDAQNFVRFDYYSSGNELNLFASTFTGGSPTVWVNHSVSGDAPMYLRVRRLGNQWTLKYSFDGETWTTTTVFNYSMSVSAVGPFVANAGGDPPAFTSAIDHFIDTANPGEPEPPGDSDPPNDPDPDPVISWASPEDGTQVSGNVSLSVFAPEDTARVEFVTDPLGEIGLVDSGPDDSGTWTILWDTTTVPNAEYLIAARSFASGVELPTAEDAIAVVVLNSSDSSGDRVIDGLVNLYTFNNGGGNIVPDVSGSGNPLDLEIENPGAASWGEGTLTLPTPNRITSDGSATEFTGAVGSANEISVEAWITPIHASQSGPARIVTSSNGLLERNFMLGQGQPNGGSGSRYEARLRTTATNDNGQPSLVSANNTASVQLQHLLYTRNSAGDARLYIDGVEVAAEMIGGNLSNWNSGYRFALGNEIGADRPWIGTYHLVATYDRALTVSEVQQNFNYGPDYWSDHEREPVLTVSWVSPQNGSMVSGDTQLEVIAPVETVQVDYLLISSVSTEVVGSVSGEPWVFQFDTTQIADAQYTLVARAFGQDLSSLLAESSVTVSVVNQSTRVENGLVSLYTFDDGNGDTVADSSGIGEPLNLQIEDPASVTWGHGSLTVSSPNRIATGTSANKLFEALTVSNAVTIEAWVTPANASQNGPARIATMSDGLTSRNFMLGHGKPNGGNGAEYEARLRTTATNNNGQPSLVSPSNSASNSLQHLIYTRDTDGVARFYIDGVEAASGLVGGDLSNWNDGYHFALANEIGASRPWLGTYHLVAIYDRSLSPSEVHQNFSYGP
jgi:regulation of enolase protein 1 (concanavalin A-like superfamily)